MAGVHQACKMEGINQWTMGWLQYAYNIPHYKPNGHLKAN